MRHEQGGEEDDGEIDNERRGHPHHGDDLVHDAVALGREEDEDGEEEADERPRGQVFEENGVVPVRARPFSNRKAGDDGGAEGDAEEDGHARRDGRIRHIDPVAAAAANDGDEKDRQRRIEHHLQHGINRNKHRAVLDIPAREPRPHEHHGDAPRHPDQNQPLPQPLLIRQKGPREREHERGSRDPIDGNRKSDLDPEIPPPLLLAQGAAAAAAAAAVQGFEADFAQDGVHHDEEAEGDGEGDGGEVPALQRAGRAGDEGAEEDARRDGEEDPEGQEAVEEGEGGEGGGRGGGGGGGGRGGLLFGVGGGGDWEGGWGGGGEGDGLRGGRGGVLHIGGVWAWGFCWGGGFVSEEKGAS